MDKSVTQSADPEVAKALKLGRKKGRGIVPLLTIGVALLVVLFVAFKAFAPKPPPAYELGGVTRGVLDIKVTATGTLQPLNQVDVGAEVSGRIDTVFVDFNDRVEKGQILAQINTDQLSARLAQSKASLTQAEARLADAKAALADSKLNLGRVEPLAKTGNASKATLDSARLAVARADANQKNAAAQVELAKAALDADAASLDKATIKAPTSGIVLDRLVEPGQTVAATFQTPVLFKLAEDLKRMELEVDIDEADIGSVAEGQKATFTVDAYPGRTFRAQIISVHNAPKTEQGVVTYQAVLSVDNPDLVLKPGMTATAEIFAKHFNSVLTVPSGALRFVPEGAPEDPPKPLADGSGNFAAKLWLPSGAAKPRSVDVVAGASDDVRTVIVKGDVKEGQMVITDMKRTNRPSGFGPPRP